VQIEEIANGNLKFKFCNLQFAMKRSDKGPIV